MESNSFFCGSRWYSKYSMMFKIKYFLSQLYSRIFTRTGCSKYIYPKNIQDFMVHVTKKWVGSSHGSCSGANLGEETSSAIAKSGYLSYSGWIINHYPIIQQFKEVSLPPKTNGKSPFLITDTSSNGWFATVSCYIVRFPGCIPGFYSQSHDFMLHPYSWL